MKKALIILLAVAILAVATIALAGVSGTYHDVTKLRNNASLEPCAFCHTPHGGNNTVAPLWNRSQATQTYTVYTSSTFNMGPGTTPLDKGSAPCMVCHNGVASSLINYPGRGSTANSSYDLVNSDTLFSAWSRLGTDLQNEHPVSFTYNNAADAQGNNFPAAASSGSSAWIPGTGLNYPLYNNSTLTSYVQFSCATCHAVHDTGSYAGKGSAQVYFLRTTNAGSNMCKQCHTARY